MDIVLLNLKFLQIELAEVQRLKSNRLNISKSEQFPLVEMEETNILRNNIQRIDKKCRTLENT